MSRLRAAAATALALTVAACASISPPSPADLGIREDIVETALGQIGRPYRYGGDDPSGFDCSGLVEYAYAAAGIKVPRTARAQLHDGRRIDLDQALPGDLLVYRIAESGDSLHVAIYLGHDRMIHAPERNREVSVVGIDSPFWKDNFVTALRLLR
jgi:murein DD-endopeptidase